MCSYVQLPNYVCLSVYSALFLPNSATQKKLVKTKYVPLGEAITEKSLNLYLHRWVQIQTNLYLYYFLCRKIIGIIMRCVYTRLIVCDVARQILLHKNASTM
jgi:hypothetical protein